MPDPFFVLPNGNAVAAVQISIQGHVYRLRAATIVYMLDQMHCTLPGLKAASEKPHDGTRCPVAASTPAIERGPAQEEAHVRTAS